VKLITCGGVVPSLRRIGIKRQLEIPLYIRPQYNVCKF
jgi:hypothetical protein